MTIFPFKALATLLFASVQQAPRQDFTPPTPRSELERLVLSPDDSRNQHVAAWLTARAADPALVRRELFTIGFERVAPLRAGCDSYSLGRVVGPNGEELRARIELCPSKEPFVMLLRGFFENMQAPQPNSNAPTMSIPLPAPIAPPAPPAPPK